jgi:hypothetical protein
VKVIILWGDLPFYPAHQAPLASLAPSLNDETTTTTTTTTIRVERV